MGRKRTYTQEQRKIDEERAAQPTNYGDFSKGAYNSRLNRYSIHAKNRAGKEIAHATAEGSTQMHNARRKIHRDKHTWIKFVTYNRTRGKFLKG